MDVDGFRAAMAADGIEEVVEVAISLFLGESPAVVAELEEALAEGGAETARRAAHTLKGSALTIHAGGLHRLAAALESAAEVGDLVRAGELAAGLRPEYERAVAYLSDRGFAP